MARIRTVKPEFFKHYELYQAEKKYSLPLRTAFIGIWCCSDKEGRFKWNPMQLKLDILPYDDINFEDVLNALCLSGFIKKYEYDNKFYGHVPSFKDHQRVVGTEAQYESKLPAPPKNGIYLEVPRNHLGIAK